MDTVEGLMLDPKVVPRVSTVVSVATLIMEGEGSGFRKSYGDGHGLTKCCWRPSSMGTKP